MANPVVESAVESIELEQFGTEIADFVPYCKTLYTTFKEKAKTVPISNITEGGSTTRPSWRVVFRPQGGSAIAQGTGNGDSLGRGTGSQWAAFVSSPVFTFGVNEITYLARKATEGKKRGLFEVKAAELKNALKSYMQGLEGLMNSDGTGTFDTIPSTATINNGTGSGQSLSSIVGMNNAMPFTDQQTVQVISSGGTNRGSFVISYVDPVLQTLYSATALPAGTTTTDLLVVAGASGAAGSSIYGLRYWQTNATTGTVAGVNRANFPSRISTPNINLNGGPVTTSTPFRANVILGRALGPDAEGMESATWYCGPDQEDAVNNLYLNVLTQNSRVDVKGNKGLDMAPKYAPPTFGNRELHVGYSALPGRLDLLTWDTWYMGEMIPPELYDFGGGVTVMPVPDFSGGGSYLTSDMFVFNSAIQLCNSNPRAGLYISSAAIPTI